MAGNKFADEVFIPVIMIGESCMINIMEQYPSRNGSVFSFFAKFIKFIKIEIM